MADLQTELFTKVLPKMQSLNNLNFDDPEQPEVPVSTPEPEILSNNEMIFDYVKEHPACYGPDVVKHFTGRIGSRSVLSQIHTMSRRGLFHKVKCSSSGLLMYSAAVDAYPRAKGTERTARLLAALDKMTPEERGARIKEGHRKAKLKQAEQMLATVTEAVRPKKEPVAPKAAPTVVVAPVDLNTLSIVQARKLYDELKQIFGA